MRYHLLLMFLFVCSTPAAFACTVCGTTFEQSRWAFILTTGLLTFIPLIAIGGGAYYFYKRSQREGHDL